MDDAKITKPNRQETKAQANRAYKAMNTLLFDGVVLSLKTYICVNHLLQTGTQQH